MAEVPLELPTGRVVGKFIFEVQDNNDPGEEPQLVPVTGDVIIKSSIDNLSIFDQSLGKFITFRGPHKAVINSEGELATPDPITGDPMYTGMSLWSNDSDKLSVKGWTYTATFNLKTADGKALNLPPATFTLATGQEVDLADVIRVPATPGYGLPQAEGAALRAEAAALASSISSQGADQAAQQALASAQAAQASAEIMEVANDQSMSAVIEDPESEFSTHLSAATVGRGMPTADDGHEYVWLAGVIRNTGDGSGWQLLPESTNHRPINIDTIDTVTDASGKTGYIRVNYPQAVGSAGMTVAFLAVPDETLARNGFTTGTSVTQTYTDIRISQSAAMASDYVYYDGTKWVSYDGIFTPTFTAGKLTLTHAGVPLEAQYALNVESRGSTHEARVSTGAGENSASKITLNIFETPGSVSDYVYYDGANWQSQSGEFTGFSFSGGVLTMNHAQIATEGLQHVNVAGRGKILAVVSSATSPTGGTFVKIDFRDPATGDLITTPNTDMRAYVSHGGEGGRLAPVPTTDMRFYVSQGGGNRQIVPAQLDTIKYPGCNIWLYGVMGKAS